MTLPAWLERLEAAHPTAIELGLERCGRVYRQLGSPRPGRRVWTVAGTNGKGSVVAYLGGLLEAAGDTCGLFTSPHIVSFNERIVVHGRAVPDTVIVEAFEQVEAARGNVPLTYFEFTTLAALLIMHQAGLDAAVLEVGLGGRLDAVNLVDADCAVITVVGLDHQDFLGPDRDRIGREKAGIMRPGRPVVLGDADPPASVLASAAEVGSELWCLGRDFSLRRRGSRSELDIKGHRVVLPRPPLAGEHQWLNAMVAIVALAVLRPELVDRPEVLAGGIGSTRLPGRLQPSARDPRVVFDVGHNPLAAEAVAAWLEEGDAGRCFCVLGMLADKDVEAVATALCTQVDAWFCAGLSGLRGQTGVAVEKRVRKIVPEHDRVSAYPDVAGALAAARAQCGKDDVVLVFGSFQTVGDALRSLDEEPYNDPHC